MGKTFQTFRVASHLQTCKCGHEASNVGSSSSGSKSGFSLGGSVLNKLAEIWNENPIYKFKASKLKWIIEFDFFYNLNSCVSTMAIQRISSNSRVLSWNLINWTICENFPDKANSTFPFKYINIAGKTFGGPWFYFIKQNLL